MNKAVTITRHGSANVLALTEQPIVEPKGHEVRIAVRAAGLNFAEVSARQGLYPEAPKPPCVVGYELAGVVEAVGAGVGNLKIGDRVLALTKFGAHASVVNVSVQQCFVMPDEMSFATAAAIPVNYLTAHHMLFHVGTVHPSSSVLLHMAAGGVGTAVLQLLSTIPDVYVFGTASSGKHDYLRQLGCAMPIDYRTQSYEEVVQVHTRGRGVDLVLDPLGGEAWRKSWGLLAPAGRMVAYGFANGHAGHKKNLFRVLGQLAKIPFINPISAMKQNKSMQGVDMGQLWAEIEVLRLQMERIIQLWRDKVVAPQIHAVLPFSLAGDAHRMLEDGKNQGKVLLAPDHVGPDEYSQ